MAGKIVITFKKFCCKLIEDVFKSDFFRVGHKLQMSDYKGDIGRPKEYKVKFKQSVLEVMMNCKKKEICLYMGFFKN